VSLRAGEDVGEAIRSPEARERGIVTRILTIRWDWVPNVNLSIALFPDAIADPVAAAAVGQHTEAVLRELLGYADEQLARLAERDIRRGCREIVAQDVKV